MAELAMKNLCCYRIGQSCLAFGVEHPDVIFTPLNLYASSESSRLGANSARVFGKSVDHILRWRSYAQIFVAVIKSVSAYMVSVAAIIKVQPQYVAMQEKRAALPIAPDGAQGVPLSTVPILSAIHTDGCPPELGQLCEAVRRDQRNLALAQWNFTVGLFRGCHIRSNRRVGFGGTAIPTPPFYQKEAVIT